MLRTAIALLIFMSLNAGVYAQTKIEYPQTRKVEQTDDYHGTRISDPYRWLEDDNSAETKAWVEAQNRVTFAYLNSIPERAKIKARLTELWNYEKYSAPSEKGGKYFYSKNDGLQNQFVLYVSDSVKDAGRVLLDPNKLSTDGTVALNGLSISDDGKLLAYGLSASGSDWVEWRFREVETGRDLTDVLKDIKFSGASWSKDGKGVFYSRFPAVADEKAKLTSLNYNQKIYYHRLGTPQSEDVLVYERADDKEMSVGGYVSEDGKYLIVYVSKGTSPKNMIYYKDLSKADSAVLPLVDKLESSYSFIGNDGSMFYFETDKEASRGRVVAVDVSKDTKEWKEIIPEGKETLGSISFINNQFVANYLKDAYTQIRIYDTNGKFVRNVDLPGIGTAGGFSGERDDTETFYTFSSYATPPTIYRYDMKTGKSEVFRKAAVKFNPADYEVKQVKYKSKDGTEVPMFVVHKKGLKWTARIRRCFTATAVSTVP
jgi:prolyl oligopeptidase